MTNYDDAIRQISQGAASAAAKGTVSPDLPATPTGMPAGAGAAAIPLSEDDPFAGGGETGGPPEGNALPAQSGAISTPLPASTAPAAPPASPYDDAIREMSSARVMAGSLALYGAKDSNPDTAAQAARLQQQLGGSANVIEGDVAGYQKQADALRNQQVLSGNPALADWLTQNPLNPKVAQDDVPNLDAVSSWARQWSTGWSEGITGNALNRLYAQGSGVDQSKVASLEASLQAAANDPAAQGAIHFFATVAAGLADSIAKAAPYAAAGAVTGGSIGAVAAGLPTGAVAAPIGATAGAAAGGAAGFESGMWLDGYRQSAGSVMHALDGVHDAAGNPIDPTARVVAGTIAGLVGGTLNLVGLGAGGRIVGEGLSSLLSAGMAQAVARPGVGAALARAAMNVGKGGLTGAALGGAMETANVIAEQGARLTSGSDFATVLNDPQQRQDAIDQIADSAETMALQLGAIHGVGALPPVIGEALRARRATDDLAALNGLSETAQASATRQRDPATFESWVANQTADGRAENLFVPGDAVQELYQSRGITPGPDDGLLGQFVPDIADQMKQARASGGDVVLPTAGYMAHMAGTEEGAALQKHVRVGEDGMSQSDLDAYMTAHGDALQARGDELQQQFDQQRVEATGAQAVHDDMQAQLRQAGFAPDTADQYASLIASRYATRAARLGDDPFDLYRSENIAVQGPDRPQPLRGSVPDPLDTLIEAVRSGRPEQTNQALFGPSLLQFISQRGGVEDPGGDLKAMGAGDWHKGRPGVRRLLRPARADAGPGLPGMGPRGETPHSPDSVALAAHEAGYFPGAERPDINTLHDAIGRELRGEPVYSERYTSGPREARAAEYRNAVENLSSTLDRLGIDPRQASNAEIRTALDGEGQQFGQSPAPPAREPVAHLTGEEIAGKDAPVADLRAAAREYYAQHLRGTSVHSDALGRDVEFRSSRKAFSASANPDKLRLFAALRDIVQHGQLEETTAPRDPVSEQTTKAYHFVTAPVDLNGRMVRVGATIREDANGHLYYNHSPIEEARAAPDDTAREAGPGDGGDPDLRNAAGAGSEGQEPNDTLQDTADEAGPRGAAGGDTTYEQRVGSEPDGVNMEVRDFQSNADPLADDATPSDGLRGSISLSRHGSTIKLFAARDLSTFLHESGHQFLDELERDAGIEGAPEQVRVDMDAVRSWLGAEDGKPLTVENHEAFARGFEAYLMEGKAPSEALRGAFRSFRAWLVGIYRSIAGLRVELTPAIRDVMDRLLASDNEIARARDQQRLGGLFRSADEAGMTDAEWRAYAAAVERTRAQAVDGLTSKVMGDVRRERTAWWGREQEPIRDEVAADVDARPEMRAMDLLRSGRLAGADGQPGARIKLDQQELIDTHGPGILDLLPRRVPALYGHDGVPADTVAAMVGARSGNDLVDKLLAHESLRRQLRAQGDKRSVRAYSIDTAVHDRMIDRHGEVLTDGSLESEALDRVHSDRQLDVLATELRALGRRAGAEMTPLQVAKAWAERTIAGKKIGDAARPALYARAEAKAGRATEAALLAGDHAGAFRAKQQQLLNHALYRAAATAKQDIDRGLALMQRLANNAELPTIETGFADRVHELLSRFGVPIARDAEELKRGLGGVSLQSWATDRLAQGFEFFVAPELYDQTYARPVEELTVNQFRDLADTVRSLAHAGRDLEQVTVEGEKMERAVVVGQMTAAMDGLHQREGRDFVNQGGETGTRGVGERMVQGAEGFHAMLLKPETIIDTLDARDPNGIFNKAVWRPIKAAQGTENDLLREVTGQLKELHEGLGKGYGKDFDKQIPSHPGITDPRTGRPMALKRRGVIGIALNTGNESNLQRLLDGYNWTNEAVQSLLDRHMTAADWKFVQGAWDTFEGLFPRIEAMQRRMTGVGLEKVEPREVVTPHGTFRGGYYPVIYDPNLSTLGDRIKATGDQRFEADYVRATTSKGHTISRVQNVREPLSLDPDQMAWKLRQSVHDLAYREAIVNADKLLRNHDVIAGMDRTVGRDQRKQLDRWLQGVANDQNIDTRGLAAMDSFLHRLRTNAMVVGIGFRASTMLKHGSTALSNSIGELGPKWMLRGTREFFGSPDKMRRQYEFITGASAEMRHRMNEIDRDVRDALRDTMGKPGWVPALARFSHYGVAMLDMGSALPTWMGAYRKAQAEGMEEADAVAFADKTVRNAHGANGAPDLAAIQRGSEAQKLMTMFYGFFNHVYNRQAVGVQSAVAGVRHLRAGEFGAARGDFAHTLATFFFYLAMPALIEATVAEGLPTDQDGEGWLAWAGKAIGGGVPAGIPVLRDVASAAMHGRTYATSPTGQAFDTFIALGKDAASAVGLRQAPVSDRWLQHAVTAPGYVFGLPTGQAGGTAQFLADVADGQEDPQSVQDWLRGITFGPAPKKAAGQ